MSYHFSPPHPSLLFLHPRATHPPAPLRSLDAGRRISASTAPPAPAARTTSTRGGDDERARRAGVEARPTGEAGRRPPPPCFEQRRRGPALTHPRTEPASPPPSAARRPDQSRRGAPTRAGAAPSCPEQALPPGEGCCPFLYNTMDSYSSLRRWMMEEEDDDIFFSPDDDVLELLAHTLLAQSESSTRRRQSNAPPKVMRPRDGPSGHRRIKADYFAANPVYNDKQFRRRFRMQRHLFKRIKEAVKNHDDYFKRKPDACGKKGLSALQKCVAAIRILAYGLPADAVDEYVRIGESTARESLKHFCKAVIEVFGPHYLRAPTAADVARLLQEGEERGFPGMLGSIDCMHWEWKNCPAGWRGQFKGNGKHPTMILEAVASHDLWIWHAYFGMPGSNNDINVLHRSPIFSNYVRGRSSPVSFEVNGRTYNMGYYLADGIYPEWAGFVKTIRYPMEMKTQYFATQQESARKDIERAFGVLQSRFAVIRGPAYGWDRAQLNDIMIACIILHNMIVEDEQHNAGDTDFLNIGEQAVPYSNNPDREAFVAAHHRLRDPITHSQLQRDLIEHHWMRRGSQQQVQGWSQGGV